MTSTGSPVTILFDEGSGLSVTGTLDATTVAELNRSVIEFFHRPGAGEIDVLTLDLRTVSTCDQAALAAVRHAQTVCADRAVALRVIPSEAVRLAMRRP